MGVFVWSVRKKIIVGLLLLLFLVVVILTVTFSLAEKSGDVSSPRELSDELCDLVTWGGTASPPSLSSFCRHPHLCLGEGESGFAQFGGEKAKCRIPGTLKENDQCLPYYCASEYTCDRTNVNKTVRNSFLSEMSFSSPGSCRKRRNVGSSCLSDENCVQGSSCKVLNTSTTGNYYDDDDDTSIGFLAISLKDRKVCIVEKEIGASCDPSKFEWCTSDGSFCRNKVCTLEKPSLSGTECQNSSKDQEYYDYGAKRCQSYILEGSTCSDTAKCNPNFTCLNSLCVLLFTLDDPSASSYSPLSDSPLHSNRRLVQDRNSPDNSIKNFLAPRKKNTLHPFSCKPWLQFKSGRCHSPPRLCSSHAQCWGVASRMGYCSDEKRCIVPTFHGCLKEYRRLMNVLGDEYLGVEDFIVEHRLYFSSENDDEVKALQAEFFCCLKHNDYLGVPKDSKVLREKILSIIEENSLSTSTYDSILQQLELQDTAKNRALYNKTIDMDLIFTIKANPYLYMDCTKYLESAESRIDLSSLLTRTTGRLAIVYRKTSTDSQTKEKENENEKYLENLVSSLLNPRLPNHHSLLILPPEGLNLKTPSFYIPFTVEGEDALSIVRGWETEWLDEESELRRTGEEMGLSGSSYNFALGIPLDEAVELSGSKEAVISDVTIGISSVLGIDKNQVEVHELSGSKFAIVLPKGETDKTKIRSQAGDPNSELRQGVLSIYYREQNYTHISERIINLMDIYLKNLSSKRAQSFRELENELEKFDPSIAQYLSPNDWNERVPLGFKKVQSKSERSIFVAPNRFYPEELELISPLNKSNNRTQKRSEEKEEKQNLPSDNTYYSEEQPTINLKKGIRRNLYPLKPTLPYIATLILQTRRPTVFISFFLRRIETPIASSLLLIWKAILQKQFHEALLLSFSPNNQSAQSAPQSWLEVKNVTSFGPAVVGIYFDVSVPDEIEKSRGEEIKEELLVYMESFESLSSMPALEGLKEKDIYCIDKYISSFEAEKEFKWSTYPDVLHPKMYTAIVAEAESSNIIITYCEVSNFELTVVLSSVDAQLLSRQLSRLLGVPQGAIEVNIDTGWSPMAKSSNAKKVIVRFLAPYGNIKTANNDICVVTSEEAQKALNTIEGKKLFKSILPYYKSKNLAQNFEFITTNKPIRIPRGNLRFSNSRAEILIMRVTTKMPSKLEDDLLESLRKADLPSLLGVPKSRISVTSDISPGNLLFTEISIFPPTHLVYESRPLEGPINKSSQSILDRLVEGGSSLPGELSNLLRSYHNNNNSNNNNFAKQVDISISETGKFEILPTMYIIFTVSGSSDELSNNVIKAEHLISKICEIAKIDYNHNRVHYSARSTDIYDIERIRLSIFEPFEWQTQQLYTSSGWKTHYVTLLKHLRSDEELYTKIKNTKTLSIIFKSPPKLRCFLKYTNKDLCDLNVNFKLVSPVVIPTNIPTISSDVFTFKLKEAISKITNTPLKFIDVGSISLSAKKRMEAYITFKTFFLAPNTQSPFLELLHNCLNNTTCLLYKHNSTSQIYKNGPAKILPASKSFTLKSAPLPNPQTLQNIPTQPFQNALVNFIIDTIQNPNVQVEQLSLDQPTNRLSVSIQIDHALPSAIARLTSALQAPDSPIYTPNTILGRVFGKGGAELVDGRYIVRLVSGETEAAAMWVEREDLLDSLNEAFKEFDPQKGTLDLRDQDTVVYSMLLAQSSIDAFAEMIYNPSSDFFQTNTVYQEVFSAETSEVELPAHRIVSHPNVDEKVLSVTSFQDFKLGMSEVLRDILSFSNLTIGEIYIDDLNRLVTTFSFRPANAFPIDPVHALTILIDNIAKSPHLATPELGGIFQGEGTIEHSFLGCGGLNMSDVSEMPKLAIKLVSENEVTEEELGAVDYEFFKRELTEVVASSLKLDTKDEISVHNISYNGNTHLECDLHTELSGLSKHQYFKVDTASAFSIGSSIQANFQLINQALRVQGYKEFQKVELRSETNESHELFESVGFKGIMRLAGLKDESKFPFYRENIIPKIFENLLDSTESYSRIVLISCESSRAKVEVSFAVLPSTRVDFVVTKPQQNLVESIPSPAILRRLAHNFKAGKALFFSNALPFRKAHTPNSEVSIGSEGNLEGPIEWQKGIEGYVELVGIDSMKKSVARDCLAVGMGVSSERVEIDNIIEKQNDKIVVYYVILPPIPKNAPIGNFGEFQFYNGLITPKIVESVNISIDLETNNNHSIIHKNPFTVKPRVDTNPSMVAFTMSLLLNPQSPFYHLDFNESLGIARSQDIAFFDMQKLLPQTVTPLIGFTSKSFNVQQPNTKEEEEEKDNEEEDNEEDNEEEDNGMKPFGHSYYPQYDNNKANLKTTKPIMNQTVEATNDNIPRIQKKTPSKQKESSPILSNELKRPSISFQPPKSNLTSFPKIGPPPPPSPLFEKMLKDSSWKVEDSSKIDRLSDTVGTVLGGLSVISSPIANIADFSSSLNSDDFVQEELLPFLALLLNTSTSNVVLQSLLVSDQDELILNVQPLPQNEEVERSSARPLTREKSIAATEEILSESKSLWNFISEREELSEYRELVEVACGGCLKNLLEGEGPFMVVGFSNEAFALLDPHIKDKLKKSPSNAELVLRQNIFKNSLHLEELIESPKIAYTLDDEPTQFRFFEVNPQGLLQIANTYTRVSHSAIQKEGIVHEVTRIPLRKVGSDLETSQEFEAGFDVFNTATGGARIPLAQDCRVVTVEPIIPIINVHHDRRTMAWPPGFSCYYRIP